MADGADLPSFGMSAPLAVEGHLHADKMRRHVGATRLLFVGLCLYVWFISLRKPSK